MYFPWFTLLPQYFERCSLASNRPTSSKTVQERAHAWICVGGTHTGVCKQQLPTNKMPGIPILLAAAKTNEDNKGPNSWNACPTTQRLEMALRAQE